MGHLGGPLGFAMVRAVLLQPASRVGLKRLGQRDRGQVRDQARQCQDQHHARGQPDHGACSCPVPAGTRQLRQGKRADQSVPLQVRALTCTHFMNISLSQIIVAAQMKQSVDNVERQLGRGLGAHFGRRGGSHLGRDDQLADQFRLVRGGKREADDVGRPVMRQVFPVDPADGGVVHKGHRDRRAARCPHRGGRPRPAWQGCPHSTSRNPWVSEISTTMPPCRVRSGESGC